MHSIKEKNIDYVLDVGANEGQFVKELRYYGYTCGGLSCRFIWGTKGLVRNYWIY